MPPDSPAEVLEIPGTIVLRVKAHRVEHGHSLQVSLSFGDGKMPCTTWFYPTSSVSRVLSRDILLSLATHMLRELLPSGSDDEG